MSALSEDYVANDDGGECEVVKSQFLEGGCDGGGGLWHQKGGAGREDVTLGGVSTPLVKGTHSYRHCAGVSTHSDLDGNLKVFVFYIHYIYIPFDIFFKSIF